MPLTLMLTTAGPLRAVMSEKSGTAIGAGAAAVTTVAVGAAMARECMPLTRPAPEAPTTPAATRASTRRRGEESREFMVCAFPKQEQWKAV